MNAEDLDLRGFDVVIALARRCVVQLERRDQLIDPHVQLGALLGTARDDQRRARLVDQDRVHLVDDRVSQAALHAVLETEREVVAQIIEAELVVRAVGDVGGVGEALLFLRLVALDHADREAQETVDRAHPVGIALREILVDGHDVHAAAGECIEVRGKGCDQRLALARAHLGDLALMQRDAADQLHVEMPHLDGAPSRFANERERLRQERIQVLIARVALLELGGLGAQRIVGQGGEVGVVGVRGGDEGPVALQQPLVAAAENSGHQIRNGIQQGGSALERKRPILEDLCRVWARSADFPAGFAWNAEVRLGSARRGEQRAGRRWPSPVQGRALLDRCRSADRRR